MLNLFNPIYDLLFDVLTTITDIQNTLAVGCIRSVGYIDDSLVTYTGLCQSVYNDKVYSL